MQDLSPQAQRVQSALDNFDLELIVVELPKSTRTAQEAADALECKIGQIAKSLIFKGKDSGMPYLIVTSGVNRVNESKVAEMIGESVEMGNADYVKEMTGFSIGGIPPVGHNMEIPTFIDQDLDQYDEIWAAAGTPSAVFKLDPATLRMITAGLEISVT